MRVQNIELRPGNGKANWDGALERDVGGNVVNATADHGFRRTVFVDQPRVGRMLTPPRQMFFKQRLTTNDESFGFPSHFGRVEQHLKQLHMSGCKLDETEVRMHAQRRAQGFHLVSLRQQMHRFTSQKRQEQTGDRGIEANRRVHRSALP